jgi:hypothetical protein
MPQSIGNEKGNVDPSNDKESRARLLSSAVASKMVILGYSLTSHESKSCGKLPRIPAKGLLSVRRNLVILSGRVGDVFKV